jgi:hypothetical protein
MAEEPRKTPKWLQERIERDREFRALLEKRKALDEKLEAERAAREGTKE